MDLASVVDTKEETVKEHIPLVKYIASRVMIGKDRHVDYEDLVGYGMIGLMDAIEKFDKSKGIKFSTYASIRIKGSMIDELRKNSPISKGAMDKLNDYNGAIERLQNKLLREPTMNEVAEEMSMTIDEVSKIQNHINYIAMVSLEDLIFPHDDDISISGIVEDHKSPSPEKIIEEKEQTEYLKKALDLLGERDRTVLTLYYYEGLTLRQIGDILGVSESRVCQLNSRAIVNLRNAMAKLKYK